MKIKIPIGNTLYIDEISEKNHKFTCEECGRKIYGKKTKYDKKSTKKVWCLKCLIEMYERYERYESYNKTLKKVKERFGADLVVEAL